MTRSKTTRLTLSGAASLLALSLASGNAWAEEKQFNIEAQPLAKALLEFNEQSGLTVAAPRDLVQGKDAPAVRGAMEPDEALEKILSGSGLKSNELSTGAFTITLASVEATEPAPEPFRLAQLDQEENIREVERREDGNDEARQDVIVVTGTNIRGVQNPTTPVLQFDKENIDLSGVGSVQEFVRTIPQNFNSTTALTGNSGNPFAPSTLGRSGSSVDLRGLGAGSTLTLLNGRRVALSGFGEFFDVSVLPLSVIERVDVMTDGASAVYGSDAVGGVVNFITRKDFEGLEARARYGAVTNGNLEEYNVGVTGGENWGSGGALVSIDYRESEPLLVADRDYVDLAVTFPDATLFPEEAALSIFFSANQQLTDRLSVAVDSIYSNKNSEVNQFFLSAAQTLRNDIDTYFVSGRVDYEASESITASLFLDYGNDENNDSDSRDFTDIDTFTNKLLAVEGQVSGELIEVPSGSVSFALGGLYRRESYDRSNGTFTAKPERDVLAAYGEFLIPVVSDTQNIPLVNEFIISAAGRYEDYSDFGDSFNPKFGVFWGLTEDVSVRGTYSESFRAPSLSFLFGQRQIFFFPVPVPGVDPGLQDPRNPGGTFTTLAFAASNPNLTPEVAKTWSGGLTYTPQALEGFEFNATFFDVSYSDRIQNFSLGDVLSVPEFDIFIDRSPDIGVVSDSLDLLNSGAPGITGGNFLSFTPVPADVQVILNSGLANAPSLDVRGLDVNAAYQFDVGENEFSLGINGAYLFDYRTRLTAQSEEFDGVDRVFRPVDLRLRGTMAWSRGNLTAFAALNRVDSYTDNQTGAGNAPIDAFTTVDLTLAYDGGEGAGSLTRNTRLSLSVQNLFDEDPPFVSTVDGLNYDSANASPLGRFISFQVTKAW